MDWRSQNWRLRTTAEPAQRTLFEFPEDPGDAPCAGWVASWFVQTADAGSGLLPGSRHGTRSAAIAHAGDEQGAMRRSPEKSMYMIG
jgi:hypothetical protein